MADRVQFEVLQHQCGSYLKLKLPPGMSEAAGPRLFPPALTTALCVQHRTSSCLARAMASCRPAHRCGRASPREGYPNSHRFKSTGLSTIPNR